jgi:hypothetical protein
MLKVVITTKDNSNSSFNTVEYQPVYFKSRLVAKLYRLLLLLAFAKRYKALDVEFNVEVKELELKDHLFLSNGK